MASLSWRISPRTSTVIFFDRSPFATAIVTSAMLRTCAVRFDAIELTLSVRSFQTPVTSRHLRLAAELAFGADLARDARHLRGEHAELLDHRVDDGGRLQELALAAAGRRRRGARSAAGRPAPRRRSRASLRVVGQSRSSISVLTEALHLAPGAARTGRSCTRWRVLPSRPTTWPTRSSCCAMRSLAATISLKVSAILPSMPSWSPGHADRKIAHPHGLEGVQQIVQIKWRLAVRALFRRRWRTSGFLGWPDISSHRHVRVSRRTLPRSR